MLALRTTPVVGLPQFDGWSQVTSDQRHTWICAFAVEGDNAGNVGREVLETLNAANPLTSFQVHQLLSEIILNVEQKGCQIKIGLLLVAQGKSILGVHQGIVLLKRGSKVGQILQADALQIVEGKAQQEDTFVLVTESASSFVGEVEQKLAQGYDVDTIVTSVVPGVHAARSSASMAIAFAEVIDREGIIEHTEIMDDQLQEARPEPAAVNPPPVEVVAEDPDVEAAVVEAAAEEAVPAEPSTQVSEEKPSTSSSSRLTTVRQVWVPRILSLIKQILLAMFTGIVFLGKQSYRLIQQARGKEVYVGEARPNKRILIAVGAVVLLLLAVGIFGWWQLRVRSEQRMTAEAAVEQYIEALAVARSQAEENPIAARTQTSQILSDLESLQEVYQDQPAAQRVVTRVQSEAETFYQEISGREEFEELPTYYDLRLVETDFIGSRVAINEGTLYFLDKDRADVVGLTIDSKQISRIPDGEWSGGNDLTVDDDGVVWVLANGIYQSQRDNAFTRAREGEDQLSGARAMGTYGGNIYVLNPNSRAIYRYAPNEDDGLSDPVSWLQDPLPAEWGLAQDIAIDGDIWLLLENGQLFQLSGRGVEAEITISGLPEQLSGPVAIYTEEDWENLYVLDPDSHRLIVVTKEGEFLQEVTSQTLASVTDFVVNETQDRVFLLSGSLVYQLDL